ncbi:MAG: glycosyltransferase [Planctomycetes bacterium]|nr:glycosyltransferase [Planctomycetota bacterium]
MKMGVYAETVRAHMAGSMPEPALPRDTGWIVITTGDLPARDVRELFPSPPRLLVLTTAAPRPPSRGVTYGRILPGPPPTVDPSLHDALRSGYGAAILLDGVSSTSGRVLWQLSSLGVRHVATRGPGTWGVTRTRSLALRKPLSRFEERFDRSRVGRWYHRRLDRARAHLALRSRNRQAFHGEHQWEAHLARVEPLVRPRAHGAPLDVLLYIGQLNSGGAERQLCNVAKGLRAAGHDVRVLTTYPLADENGHYCDDLLRAGVRFGVAGASADPAALQRLLDLDIHPELVGSLPDVIRNPVLDLAGELLRRPPDVLHCWLDYPNVIGAASAALVGLPHAILSTRNLNPRYFPSFYQAWMDDWYRLLARRPGVHFVANSIQGARDYAGWLELPEERFDVVRNGVDLHGMGLPKPAEVDAVRAELGLAEGDRLVAGVFRLASEKQPMLFLDVVERALVKVPRLTVALAGVGELRPQVETHLRRRGLHEKVRLLGQRKDVIALLGAADAMLLTSSVEGTPNVVLEAQWAGCPPVATAAGGTPDALLHGETGFLHEIDDVEGLTRSLVRVLLDDSLRLEMGRAGHAFVQERFGLGRMIDETLAHYACVLREPVGRGTSGTAASGAEHGTAAGRGPGAATHGPAGHGAGAATRPDATPREASAAS